MGFMTAVTTCFGKYVGFTGRARRAEYWWFFLFVIIAATIAMILDHIIDPPPEGVPFSIGIVYGLVALACLLPGLAVEIRRLHDTNHSGWWLFIAIVPIIGPLLLLYWFIIKGTSGDNKYGPDPLSGM